MGERGVNAQESGSLLALGVIKLSKIFIGRILKK